eukprot:1591424-Alexandrium_andersonii.AAC.1
MDLPGRHPHAGTWPMGRGSGGTGRYRSNPTTNCARIRNPGCARNWGLESRPEREHPHTRTSRPGCPLAPEVPARPGSTARCSERGPPCGCPGP